MVKKQDASPRRTSQTNRASADKRTYFRQSDFALTDLQQAQQLASALVDNFAGKDGPPPDIALAIGISPTSSAWPVLAGASIAYGLTEGGVGASTIKLTPLGRKLVAPEEEGVDLLARREAVLKPRIAKDFFERYRRAKFPNNAIAANFLRTLGLPANRVQAAINTLEANGRYAGLIRDTPNGMFVSLDSPAVPGPATTPTNRARDLEAEESGPPNPELAPSSLPDFTPLPLSQPSQVAILSDPKANRVFISHGKQRAVANQIKELLAFGKFEPVVSIDREATAISVPEKVFEDMRSCAAGVIHVGNEGKYIDRSGAEHSKINDNVLIEIGAAIALYGKKVVLLVERDVTLPSNLQGLYRCDFEGDKLDYEATMKLLKTFSQFR